MLYSSVFEIIVWLKHDLAKMYSCAYYHAHESRTLELVLYQMNLL
jgi:hypothetical protein